VLVDELQDTDPAQLELLAALAGGGADVVAVGDPDQSIYGFRGADPSAVSGFPERFRSRGDGPARVLALSTSRRFTPPLLEATRRSVARIGTGGAGVSHRELAPAADSADDAGDPPVVAVFRSASQEAAWIAARLREAHLRAGVPWSSMAVLVRSAAGAAPVLRRALTSAGVPVTQSAADVPLALQPFVKALLLLVRIAADTGRLDSAATEELLLSPLGGADVLSLRRLRRELRTLELAGGGGRSSGDLLAELLRDPVSLVALDERAARPARRVVELLAVVREALAAPGADAESVLWAAWRATGLAQRWERVSAGGGPAGAAADRDLDAALALFEAAARFVDRLPGAQVTGFLEALSAQQVASEALARPADLPDGVRVLTAHASKGLEWDVVCVAGVQEGTWPDLRVRGSFLGSERLLELLDGGVGVDAAAGCESGSAAAAAAAPGSRTAATVATLSRLLDEERRLFYVACTRARRHLLVSAVTSEREGLQPSRFLDELAPLPAGLDARPVTVPARAMSLAGVVGALRQVVVTPDAPQGLRDAAASRLADLSDAAVPGADPRTWWGLAPLSDDRPVREADEPVPVSPSRVDAFGTCPLRWFLESAGGGDGPGVRQAVGTAVHAVAEQARAGATDEELLGLLRSALRGVDIGRGWVARQETERAEAMVRRLGAWLRASAASWSARRSTSRSRSVARRFAGASTGWSATPTVGRWWST
jgi:superfamily I DNA/RNA helicase